MKKLKQKIISFALIGTMLLSCMHTAAFADSTSNIYKSTEIAGVDSNDFQSFNDENETFLWGDATFKVNVSESGMYMLALKYQSLETSGVEIKLNGNSVANFNHSGLGDLDANIKKSELATWTSIQSLNLGENTVAVHFDNANEDGLTYSLSVVPAVGVDLVSDSAGIFPVEVTYKSKTVEEENRKIEFICGGEAYAIKYPVLDKSENKFIFDMNLAEGKNFISADENVEIVSANIFTGTSRRFSGLELNTSKNIAKENKDATTATIPVGKANMDVVYAIEGETEAEAAATPKKGVILTYYAPADGKYNFIMSAGIEWAHKIYAYYNGKKVLEKDGIYTDGASILGNYSFSADLKKGKNEIFLATYDSNVWKGTLYINYIDVESTATATVAAQEAGIAAVELKYKSKTNEGVPTINASNKAVDTRAISFTCGDKTYTINHALLDTEEHSIIFDMDLAKGNNTIICNAGGIEIVSANLYTASTRHYVGYELGNGTIATIAADTNKTSYVLSGRATATVSVKLDGDSEPQSRSGVILKYYAPADGTYNVTMSYGTEWHEAYAYLNGGSKKGGYYSCSNGTPVQKTESWTWDMKKGENEIFLTAMNNGKYTKNLYIEYVDIEAPTNISINAQEAGIAAVELKYKSKTAETASREISFTCGNKTYTIYRPVLDAMEQSFIFDMELAQGNNTIICNAGGIEMVSASLYNGNDRRYWGYNLDNVDRKEETVYVNPNEVKKWIGRASNKVTNQLEGEEAATEKYGVEFKYYAPADGKYYISMNAGTWWAKNIYVCVNGKNVLNTSTYYHGSTGMPDMAMRNVVVDMKKGANTLYLTAYNNNAPSHELVIEYIDIGRVNTPEISEANGKVNVSATLYNPSENESEIALILARYDAQNNLVDIVSDRKTLKKGKFDSAEIKNANAINGATTKVFIWNMSTLEPLN